MAATRERVGIADFDADVLSEAELSALAGKVDVRIDDACETDYPRLRSAKVLVRTKAGAEHRRYIDEPLGSARHPLSDEALLTKFDEMVIPVLGEASNERLKSAVLAIQQIEDIDILLNTPNAK